MPYIANLNVIIPENERIIMPISMMNQPLQRGEQLKATLTELKNRGLQERTTILVCGYLNRHNLNDSPEEAAQQQEQEFINDNAGMLKGFTIVGWKSYFYDSDRKEKFKQNLDIITSASNPGSQFYEKIEKTWKKFFGRSDFQASLAYQREEYAAILTIDEQHLIYPKRMTDAIAYFYNHIAGKKPVYHTISINKAEPELSKTVSNGKNSMFFPQKNKQLSFAGRQILRNIKEILESPEISQNEKLLFLEELANMTTESIPLINATLNGLASLPLRGSTELRA